ncbi:MAG: hypothetical protein Q9225_005675 [Loekoesia sp. 1 TL-2023]
MSIRELKLASSKDWDAWITIVKGKAIAYRIWDLIDPSKVEKPTPLEKPEEPELDIPDNEEEEEYTKLLVRYKLQMAKYKSQRSKWKEQHESFTKLIDFIYDTITVANIVYIQKIEVHPWNILRALKQKLAPPDSAYSLGVRKYQPLHQKDVW